MWKLSFHWLLHPPHGPQWPGGPSGGLSNTLSMVESSAGTSGDHLVTRMGLARAQSSGLGLGFVPWSVQEKYDPSQPPYLTPLLLFTDLFTIPWSQLAYICVVKEFYH